MTTRWFGTFFTKIFDGFWEHIGLLFAIGFCVSFYCGVMFPLYKAVQSDGKVDFCYVDVPVHAAPNCKMRLVQHVPWANDRTADGCVESMEDAKKKAEILECPLR